MALIELLTENYSKSQQVLGLQEAIDYYVESLKTAKTDMFNQFRVKTATWGLTSWEKSLGIEADVSASNEFRRERICAKLRGTGTITKAMIEQVATAYSNGEVNVIEYPSENRFVVKFVGTLGIPANMTDLTLTIEEIKPAHLSFTFEYTYRRWGELTSHLWSDVATKTWYQMSTE